MENSGFNRWTDAVRHLNEKINDNQLIAGNNIKLERTGYGVRINCTAKRLAGDTYNGYFKAVQTSDNEIKIVDGLADDYTIEEIAGDALINDKLFTDIAVAEFTITADSFIYLISTAGATEPNTPTLQIFSSKQNYELGKSKTLISRVKFSNCKITNFSQESHGVIIGYIDGDCEN